MNENISGKITRLFGDCPKPDGWFSGIVNTKEKGAIMVNGKPGFKVELGMNIKAAIKDRKSTFKGNVTYVLDDNSISQVFPSNEKTIIGFLSGPDFKGVGFSAAQKLYAAFGANVFDVIKNEPDRLIPEAGITEGQKSVLINGIVGYAGNLMSRYPQLRRTQAINLLKEFNDMVGDIIKAINDDVYALINRVRGFDFDTADRIFLEALGKPKTHRERLCSILRLVVQEYVSETGHNYVDLEDSYSYNTLISMFNAKAGVQLNGAQLSQIINGTGTYQRRTNCTLVDENGKAHLYVTDDYQAQGYIIDAIKNQQVNFPVNMLKQALNMTLSSIADPSKTLSVEQKVATATSLAAGFSIITGGPGKGKSTLMYTICRTWQNANAGSRMKMPGWFQSGPDNIVLIAPTGRAAKNLSEKTGIKAMTAAKLTIRRQLIHNSIELNNKREFSIEGMTLKKGGLAIIDECSMLGTRTMGHLLQILVLWLRMQVILVGDPEQLPAIENGSPFLDLIRSKKVPVSVLTINFRTNGKEIMENADRICKGDTNLVTGPSFHTTYMDDDETIANTISSLYYQKMGINPSNPSMPTIGMFRKNLLLCPVNKGPAGIHAMNSVIQDMVNPETQGKFYDEDPTIINSPKCTMDAGYSIPGTFQNAGRTRKLPDGRDVKWTRLRIGDRVVNTENNPEQILKKRERNALNGKVLSEETGINNGDCGIIVKYTKPHKEKLPRITVKMDNGMFTDFYLDPDDPQALKLQLGYALTVHKAQGSEAKSVIISMPHLIDHIPEDIDFATRNLLNTAVTRAIDETYIIGSETAVNKCILNPAKKRASTLADYL